MAVGTGLPEVKGGTVLAQAPGGVSADSLFNAASWSQIAAAGDKLGDAANASLKVTEHQAKVGYLADQDVEITRKRIELSNEFANDPESSQKFDAAWRGYTEGKLAAVDPQYVGQVRARLGQEGNTAYSSLLTRQTADVQRRSNESWNALETSAANDVTGAAMAGTLNTPEGQVKMDRYRSILQTGVTSKFIVPEEAERRGGNLESTAFIYASRDGVQKTFNADGPIAATKQIDDIVRNENLKLTPEQRIGLGARLRADVHAWDAERQQNLSAVDLEAQSLMTAKQGGISIPDSRINEVVDRYKRFGGADKAASFLADVQHADQLSFLSRAPVAESAAWVNGQMITRGFRTPQASPDQVSAINDAATRLGIAPRDLAAAISYETGGTFNPNMWGGKNNNYLGLIQFGPEERARYGVKPGMSIEQQMLAVEGFLRDRGVKPGMGVSEIYRTINGGNPNANLNASDGNGTIAEHIDRIKAGHYGNADRFLGTKPGAAPAGTPSDIAFLGKANAAVSQRVSERTDAVIANMKNDVLPTQNEINDLVTAAASTNNPDVLQKVSAAAGEYQFRRQFGRAPLPQEQAAVSDMQRKAQTDGLEIAGDARRLEMAQEIVTQTQKKLEDDPLSHTISSMGDTTTMPTPKPLNVGNSPAFVAGLQERAQWAALGARNFQTGAMPAVTTAEAAQIRGALDAANPAEKARIYRDITSLPADTRAATLTKIASSKGATGMVEAFAGSMFGAEPAVGESIMRGQAAMIGRENLNLEKSTNKDAAVEALDKALPPNAFSLPARSDPKGAYATMRGAVIARAADIANTDPSFKGEFTDSMIQRAVSDVTGGIVTHNGAPVIVPIRGMTQKQFDQRIWGLKDADLAGVTTQTGTPITPEYVRANAQLESRSDGTYRIRLGSDADRPIYAFRDVGAAVQGRMRPFVLDLRGVTPNLNAAPPLFVNAMPMP